MFFDFFERSTRKAREFYREEELDAFWKWVQRENTNRSYVVSIDLPLQKATYDESRTSVRRGERELDFIIGERMRLDTDHWCLLYYSPAIEIWENKKRYQEAGAFPLRFGLSVEEKAALTRFSRATMERYFNPQRSAPTLSRVSDFRQKERTSLDVALWIRGELRGSIVVSDMPFTEGLRLASLRVLRDTRMKPVELHELETARIEVHVFSSLRVPLTYSEKKGRVIDGQRGYFVTDGNKRGWYLPMVFNCVSYARMEEVVCDLVLRKAQIESDNPLALPTASFLTEGWIEDTHNEVRELVGPVPKAFVSEENLHAEMKQCGDRAAGWLLHCQKEDGYIPLYADPLKRGFGRIDWPRLACTAHALAAYGKATRQPLFLQAAEKMVAYVDRLLTDVPGLPRTKIVSTLIYRALAADMLGQQEEREHTVATIAGNIDQLTYEPICFANLASLFALNLSPNPAYLETSVRLADRVFQDFERTKQSAELACFPELVNAYQLLFTATGSELFVQRKKRIEDWYVSEQLPDGSFPSRHASSYAYTRGTGKIFEVLALAPEHHARALHQCFSWLSHMQYDDSNLYFVQPSFRPYVQGGFRHDLVKSEAWIDAAAHMLLGISRILEDRVGGDNRAGFRESQVYSIDDTTYGQNQKNI